MQRGIVWLVVVAAGVLPMPALAEAPAWWAQKSFVFVSVERPAAAIDHPFIRDVWQAVASSPAVQVERKAIDQLKLERLRKLLESSLGSDWKKVLDSLTSRAWLGMTLPAAGQQPEVTIVIEAQDPQTLSQFLLAIHKQLAKQSPPVIPQFRESNGHEWFQIGDASYAASGRYLLMGSRPKVLEALLAQVPKLPPDTAAPALPRLTVDVNLEQLRSIPPFRQGLKWPTDNPGVVSVAGGYVDLLRRARMLQADLRFEASAVTLTVTADAGTAGMPAGLQGFFSTGAGNAPAPLLELPDTLWSSSWVRDYAPLWSHRRDFVAGSAVEPFEAEYEKQRGRYGFGVDEALSWIGTRWRVGVARQTKTVYREEPVEKLPAAVLVLDIRDEAAFGEKVFPTLDKLVRGPITLVFGYPKYTEYRGAKITSVRIKEPEDSPPPPDYRYSVSPAMTVTRSHFIVGSTEQIVHQTIDELSRQAEGSATSGPEGLTELQRISFHQAAALTHDFRDALLRKIVLEGGLTVSEAEQNTAAIAKLLDRLGEMRSSVVVTSDRLTATIRIGK